MRKIYDKVVAVLSEIPTDKYIHCIVVMIIASVFSTYCLLACCYGS